jgi:prenyltransferase beta subunit
MLAGQRGFRLEMLQVARLAPRVLGEAADLVSAFFQSQLTPKGGFGDRDGQPDLYYTVFGLEGFLILQMDLPQTTTADYLRSFGDGAGLDFVHLCSLVRCAANLGVPIFTKEQQLRLAERVEAFRTPDGGYHGSPNKTQGSAYGALLACGLYADLGLMPPEPERLGMSLFGLQLDDGSYANEPGLRQGTVTATAAAVTLLRLAGAPTDPRTGEWLLRQALPQGGFLATPGAPLPDLLSTATALHALSSLGVDFSAIKEPCLDFVDSLWSAQGGFHGHWADDDLDAEYTCYGLLALGHLSY